MNTEEQIQAFRETYAALRTEIGKVIVGHEEIVDGTLGALLAGGHVLLEGVPGLGKTLLVRTLGEVMDLPFSRIQFTPDLVPADILGTNIVMETGEGRREFVFQKGPIFAHLILADEINRATPKTQSALLEAMQEHSVTAGGEIRRLGEPFFVLATQNPIDQEGTYPLPEAQLDRFMMEIHIDYPSPQQEEQIVMSTSGAAPKLPAAAFDKDAFLELRDLVWSVPIPEVVAAYAVKLCGASRPTDPRATPMVKQYVAWGAGPRGSQNLVRAAKARALLDGRTAPTIEDVQQIALPILRHRILVNHRAVGDGVGSEPIIEHLLGEMG
jgi:MoxR-like ATPase